jgi:hypothetical protein
MGISLREQANIHVWRMMLYHLPRVGKKFLSVGRSGGWSLLVNAGVNGKWEEGCKSVRQFLAGAGDEETSRDQGGDHSGERRIAKGILIVGQKIIAQKDEGEVSCRRVVLAEVMNSPLNPLFNRIDYRESLAGQREKIF